MKNRVLFTAVCIIAVFILSACGSAEPTTALVTEIPASPPTPTSEPSATPSPTIAPKPEPTRVEFQALDGRALVGYYYPSPNPNAPVVVLMHMMGRTQQDWVRLGLVDWLQNWPSSGSAGLSAPARQMSIYPPMPPGLSFAVFTFDYRGYGESNVPAMPDFGRMTADEFNQVLAQWLSDSEAAYEQAKALPGVDPQRVAGIGASIGAAGVVYACGEGCLGALSLSPGDEPTEPYADVVKRLDDAGKPIECIAHEKDKYAAQTCESASGTYYTSQIYSEGGGERGLHGMDLLEPDDAPGGIGQRIQDFLFRVFDVTP